MIGMLEKIIMLSERKTESGNGNRKTLNGLSKRKMLIILSKRKMINDYVLSSG